MEKNGGRSAQMLPSISMIGNVIVVIVRAAFFP